MFDYAIVLLFVVLITLGIYLTVISFFYIINEAIEEDEEDQKDKI